MKLAANISYQIALWLSVFLVLGCSGSGSTNSNNAKDQPPTLTSISLSPANPTVNLYDVITITVIGHYSDGTSVPFTDSDIVSWITYSGSGLVIEPDRLNRGVMQLTAKSRGSATLTAYYSVPMVNKRLQSNTTVTVVPVYLGTEIVPGSLKILPNLTKNFTAIERYNDGLDEDVTENVTWGVIDSNIGIVSNEGGTKGEFNAIAPGSTQIYAINDAEETIVAVEVVSTYLVNNPGSSFPPDRQIRQAVATINAQDEITAIFGDQTNKELFSVDFNGLDWDPAVQINSLQIPSDSIYSENLYSNNTGARLVVWEGFDNVYSLYAGKNESFGDVKIIPLDINTFFDIDAIVITNNDERLVLWNGNGRTHISKFNFDTSSWDSAEELVSHHASIAKFNSNGDAVLVWKEPTATTCDLYSAVYTNGSGPGTGLQLPELLFTKPGNCMQEEVDAAINDNRDIVVAWSEYPNSILEGRAVYSVHYSEQDGWSTVAPLPMGIGKSAGDVKVAMNELGDTFAAWTDNFSNSIYTNRFTKVDGWNAEEKLNEVRRAPTASIYTLSVGSSGNAICVYNHASVYYRRYVKGEGWQGETLMDIVGLSGTVNLTLKIRYNKTGKGIMSWQELVSLPNPGGGNYSTYFNLLEIAPQINP